jgi:fimbrial isopeptide formation D2 family protein/uncharacterized repeat protein (TIGR01451 family)
MSIINSLSTHNQKGDRMKVSFLLNLGAICLLVLLISGNALAAGTPAGTVISNFATMNYKDVGGNPFPAFNSDTVTIVVAQKAGVVVSPANASQVSGDSSYVYYPVVVTNVGNGTDVFDLASVSSQGWGPQLFQDSNRNGVLDSAELAAGAVTVTSSLDADSAFYLIARIFVPDGTPSNTQDQLTVTATSQFDNGVSDSGVYTTTVSTAVVDLDKSVDNNNPEPGQTVTYTVGYNNTGTSTALNSVLTDVLNTNLTLVNGSINITAGDSASYNSGNRTITWYISRIGGGESAQMTFQTTVNDGVPAGTVINNQAHLEYEDSVSGRPRKPDSPTIPITVKQKPGIDIAVTPPTKTQDVGLAVFYQITITNTGNFTDSASMSYTTSLPLTWTFYVDADNNGIAGDNGDYIWDRSNTGSLLQNESIHIIAIDTIPTATPDGSIDTSFYTASSLNYPSTSDVDSSITTVRAPVMAMTKSVAVMGGGDPIPGATLIYTITYQNNGTGAANSVVVSDVSPTNTTYVGESVVLNSVGKTDQSGDDEVTVSGGIITVNIGTIAAGGSGTIEFKVTIN